MLYVDPTTRDLQLTPAERAAQQLLCLPQPLPQFRPSRLAEVRHQILNAAAAIGVADFADGEFEPEDTSLQQGVLRRQISLLDAVGCDRPNFRLLVVGCGNGSFLRQARMRGAVAIGISICAEQVDHCQLANEDAFCCSLRDLRDAPQWHGKFDGVILNDPLDHWDCQSDEQASNALRELFGLVSELLDPDSIDGRCVTTMHYRFGREQTGTKTRQEAISTRGLSTSFACPNHWEAEPSANRWFALADEWDCTEDYKTAKEFLHAAVSSHWYRSPTMLVRLLRTWWRHSDETKVVFRELLGRQPGERPAADDRRLLRQVWLRNEPPCTSSADTDCDPASQHVAHA